MVVCILETDYPSGRTWASLFNASDNSPECKYCHEDKLSVPDKLSPLFSSVQFICFATNITRETNTVLRL